MSGLEFMRPLVEDMVQDDPSKRPTMDQVVERFTKLHKSLSWWTLTTRLVRNEESRHTRITAPIRHFFRTTVDTLAFRSALPTPST